MSIDDSRLWIRLGAVGLLSAILVAAPANADQWKVVEKVDEFTDLPVVTASVESEEGDSLVVRCTDEKVLHAIYAPSGMLEAEELVVRYRVDRSDVVDSALVWEKKKGQALTALTTRKSLFKNELSEPEREEFVTLLGALMVGTRFVIEADGERAAFSLTGSGKAIGDALVACDVLVDEPEG